MFRRSMRRWSLGCVAVAVALACAGVAGLPGRPGSTVTSRLRTAVFKDLRPAGDGSGVFAPCYMLIDRPLRITGAFGEVLMRAGADADGSIRVRAVLLDASAPGGSPARRFEVTLGRGAPAPGATPLVPLAASVSGVSVAPVEGQPYIWVGVPRGCTRIVHVSPEELGEPGGWLLGE